GCFYESVIAVLLDVLLHIECELDDLCERILFGRVEIPHDVIGLIVMRRAAMHLMKLDAREIRKPSERILFGGEHVINLVILASKLDVFEPRGRPLGTVLLKEGPVIDAVGPSHQSQRPAFYVTKDGGRDFEVVLDQLGFDNLLRREENLVEV